MLWSTEQSFSDRGWAQICCVPVAEYFLSQYCRRECNHLVWACPWLARHWVSVEVSVGGSSPPGLAAVKQRVMPCPGCDPQWVGMSLLDCPSHTSTSTKFTGGKLY